MSKKSEKKSDLDLNGDGKFDKEDKKLAGKALATKIEDDKSIPESGEKEEAKKEEPKKEPEQVSDDVPEEGLMASKDINLTYRKGDMVPRSQIEVWKKSGIDWKVWF